MSGTSRGRVTITLGRSGQVLLFFFFPVGLGSLKSLLILFFIIILIYFAFAF